MRAWPSIRRLARIIMVITTHVLGHLLGGHLSGWPRLAMHFQIELTGPERLRTALEEIGGTFIKFGQMLALQPDILPFDYCNALFNLLDRVAPFDYEGVERTFVEDLGRSPGEIFDYFNPNPVATASIGQVHIAYLGGRKLAVKVQRPAVETDFTGDIRLMAAAIAAIRGLHLTGLYWMIEPTSEFIAWTREELDYRREARYMEQIRRNCRTNSRERVPEVLWRYTTRRTLVAEFFEGLTVLDYLRANERGDESALSRVRDFGFDQNQFARNVIENFLSDAYLHGLFHADLHPANLMIQDKNVVGYIDFGITGVLSHYSRRNLIALTLAYTRADLQGMCSAFLRGSALGPKADAKVFREELKRMADEWYGTKGKERKLLKNFTLVMLDMLRLSRRTDIWPERDVIKYIRSAIAIDGLITRFAPSFDVGHYLESVCDYYLRWQTRREVLSYDTLIGLSDSGSRVMRDGALRLGGFLQRVASGELPVQVDTGAASRDLEDSLLSSRTTQLGVIVLVVTLLITFGGERIHLGVNLLTAQALLLVAAGVMLTRTVWSLVSH